MHGGCSFPLPFARARQRMMRSPRAASASSAVVASRSLAVSLSQIWATTEGVAGTSEAVGGVWATGPELPWAGSEPPAPP